MYRTNLTVKHRKMKMNEKLRTYVRKIRYIEIYFRRSDLLPVPLQNKSDQKF